METGTPRDHSNLSLHVQASKIRSIISTKSTDVENISAHYHLNPFRAYSPITPVTPQNHKKSWGREPRELKPSSGTTAAKNHPAHALATDSVSSPQTMTKQAIVACSQGHAHCGMPSEFGPEPPSRPDLAVGTACDAENRRREWVSASPRWSYHQKVSVRSN